MTKFIIIINVIILLFSIYDSDSANSIAGKLSCLKDFCYEFHYENEHKKTWHDARKECLDKSGDLAAPINAEIHNFFASHIKGLKNDGPYRKFQETQSVNYFWIGLKLSKTYENKIKWINGQEVSYYPHGLSLSAEGECISYYFQDLGRSTWIGKNCNDTFGFICQYPLNRSISDKPHLHIPGEQIIRIERQNGEMDRGYRFPTKTISVITRNQFCPEIIRKNITWPVTMVGEWAVANCPGSGGMATWQCVFDQDRQCPEFKGNPNFTLCYNSGVYERVLNEETMNFNPSGSMEVLNKFWTEKSSRKYSGDILKSLDTVKHLIASLDEPGRRVDEKFGQTAIMSIDSILAKDNIEIWDDIEPADRYKTVTLLMDLVENVTNVSSKDHYDPANFTFKEIAVDIRSINLSNPSSKNEEITVIGSQTSLSLPIPALLEALKDIVDSTNGSIRYASYNYGPTLSRITSGVFDGVAKTVVSEITGLSFLNLKRSITLPEGQKVKMEFKHTFNVDSTKGQIECVYWNTNRSAWDTDGCEKVSSNSSMTACQCDHLTMFTVLMNFYNTTKLSDHHKNILGWMTIVSCSISIICLFLSFMAFTCFRSLYSERTTVHRHLCLSLMLAELLFVCGIERFGDQKMCQAIAISLYFLFMSSFCWMFLEGYQLYRMLIQVFQGENSCRWFNYLLGYGISALLTAISAGWLHKDFGTEEYCWITNQSESNTIWAFAGPILIIISINVVFLSLAFKAVFCTRLAKDKSNVQKIKGWLKGSLMLLCLLGTTWFVGYFKLFDRSGASDYIFTVLNASQGTFIFVFHVICNDPCRAAIKRTLTRKCFGWRKTLNFYQYYKTSRSRSASVSTSIWYVNKSSSGLVRRNETSFNEHDNGRLDCK